MSVTLQAVLLLALTALARAAFQAGPVTPKYLDTLKSGLAEDVGETTFDNCRVRSPCFAFSLFLFRFSIFFFFFFAFFFLAFLDNANRGLCGAR